MPAGILICMTLAARCLGHSPAGSALGLGAGAPLHRSNTTPGPGSRSASPAPGSETASRQLLQSTTCAYPASVTGYDLTLGQNLASINGVQSASACLDRCMQRSLCQSAVYKPGDKGPSKCQLKESPHTDKVAGHSAWTLLWCSTGVFRSLWHVLSALWRMYVSSLHALLCNSCASRPHYLQH